MRILLYTGKGGVGKTTVAAATGLTLAARGLKTLVMSVDAAHSLADAFDLDGRLADKRRGVPVPVAENLWIQEVDVTEEIGRHWKDISGLHRDPPGRHGRRGGPRGGARDLPRDGRGLGPPLRQPLRAREGLRRPDPRLRADRRVAPVRLAPADARLVHEEALPDRAVAPEGRPPGRREGDGTSRCRPSATSTTSSRSPRSWTASTPS